MRIDTVKTKVYSFDELSDEAKSVAIWNHIQFEIDVMDEESLYHEIAVRMDKMQTPWFLAEAIRDEYKDSIIDTIEVNKYEFIENGEIY